MTDATDKEPNTKTVDNVGKEEKDKIWVVNLKGRKPQVIRDNEVYVGRQCYMGGWKLPKSIWHNPFPVKKEEDRAQSLVKYEAYIYDSDLYKHLHELEGKTLACWCYPQKCHADILRKLLTKKKRRVRIVDT